LTPTYDKGAQMRAVKPGPEEQQVPDPPSTSPPAFGPIEQLKELGELREQGILTEEEFTAEKRTLLS
jgi:hypothetical protein